MPQMDGPGLVTIERASFCQRSGTFTCDPYRPRTDRLSFYNFCQVSEETRGRACALPEKFPISVRGLLLSVNGLLLRRRQEEPSSRDDIIWPGLAYSLIRGASYLSSSLPFSLKRFPAHHFAVLAAPVRFQGAPVD